MTSLRTPLCDALGIKYPIMLAGMGSVANADLTAAVSNAGGLGVIGGTAWAPEDLDKEIRRTRELTDKPFGVDLLVPTNTLGTESEVQLPDPLPESVQQILNTAYRDLGMPGRQKPKRRPTTVQLAREQMQVILENKVPIFASGLGLSEWVVDLCKPAGVKIISLVGKVRNAKRVEALGADIIVAQGHEAGGHTGKVATLVIVPDVVDAVKVPVVAAGGIADGRAIVACLALGAQAVWIGTRFMASVEATVTPKAKEALLAAQTDDAVVSKTYSGKTSRRLRNKLIDLYESSGAPIYPMPLQGHLVIDIQERAEELQDLRYLSVPGGQNVSRIQSIKPAAEIMADLVNEAEQVLERLQRVGVT